MKKFVAALILTASVMGVSQGQSTSEYTVERSVVAAGGGTMTSDTFTVESTFGQTAVGFQAADNAAAPIGFWFADLQPTAASVSISGRARSADGNGIKNAIVSLTDQTGSVRKTLTGSFGYYRFDDIPAGQSLIVSVESKHFRFNPRFATLNDDLADFDLIGEPMSDLH